MGKKYTPEQRKEIGERLKMAREKKARLQELEAEDDKQEINEVVGSKVIEETVTISKQQMDAIISRLENLEQVKTVSTPQDVQKAQVDGMGKVAGINVPYTLDTSYYKDPRVLLYELPELERFAFKQNYQLDWVVEVLHYETKWGTNFSIPRFKLKLRKYMYDDDGNKITHLDEEGKTIVQGYLVKVGVFFVDPNDAIKTALEMGVEVEDTAEFLEKMRMELYKRWLLETLNPPKPKAAQKIREVVIGGSRVQVEEWNEIV